MRTVSEFLRPVQEIENQWITLADGCRLAARIWLPADAEQDQAEHASVANLGSFGPPLRGA